MSNGISRRQFIAAGALGSASLPIVTSAAAAVLPNLTDPRPGSWVRWLDGSEPRVMHGATFGMPWPRGKYKDRSQFALRSDGVEHSLQSWTTAYWPDGSLKWTAHAVPASMRLGEGPFEVLATRASQSTSASLNVNDTRDEIDIDTGVVRWQLSKQGSILIRSVTRAGRESLKDGRLVLLTQNKPSANEGAVEHHSYSSQIDKVTLEQKGPTRAVVKVEGMHADASGRRWLPFVVRFYFYCQSDSVRIVHTFTFDGEESRDFIRGVGLRFGVPLADALHDRHVRFAGEGQGVFAEAVRGLTGLRRNPGANVRRAQLDGVATPPIETFGQNVGRSLDLIPAFGDWSLLQTSADSFSIRKRTKEGFTWLDSDRGKRAAGLGYVGGPKGGVAFGVRNFWQSHPAQLDIRNAVSDQAEVTLWVWAPDAPPMDLRFYHDGLGQDTFAKQTAGLEITYEDYEPGFGTAVGVARTSEMTLHILPATPSRESFVQLAEVLRSAPTLVATPATLQTSGVFAHGFSLPDRSTPFKEKVETQLDWVFDFYKRQQDERSWYGFWNFGDVMHTYDSDRHTWRYDVGGFAWDNSELSTDIWLWLYFLRTGRADVFRFAEAMTRHTGEVDVHHLGKFAPLGSRHNVLHWGCSAKQLRISTALNRRYYYYLTADERVGDLMREQLEAGKTLRTIEPGRKLPDAATRPPVDPQGDYAYLGFGTDWGSLAGAWLTEWERTRNTKYRDRLVASMRTIAAQPKRFFSGGSRMNLNTGAFDIKADGRAGASHLSAAFGLPEVCAELVELLPTPAFERAWLEYCELYNAPAEQQRQALGNDLGALNLGQGHARLTAFAAHRKQSATLARRAWLEFIAGRAGYGANQPFESQRIAGSAVLNPVEEAGWVSTNSTAQWGLAAIQCLAYAPRGLDE